MEPVKHSIYKGVSGKYGAVQFSLLRPCYYCRVCREKNYSSWKHIKNTECTGKMEARSGAVLLEIASATGKNQYDWDKKVVFSLDINDLGKILTGFAKDKEVELFHDPNMKGANQGKVTKKLALSPGKDGKGGFILSVFQNSSEGKTSHSVPISPEEIRVLRILLHEAVSRVLAWRV